MLQDQIEVLNDNFAPHSIQFNLTGTTRTVNSTWSDNEDILVMKTNLRKGDYATLNLYFTRVRTTLWNNCDDTAHFQNRRCRETLKGDLISSTGPFEERLT